MTHSQTASDKMKGVDNRLKDCKGKTQGLQRLTDSKNRFPGLAQDLPERVLTLFYAEAVTDADVQQLPVGEQQQFIEEVTRLARTYNDSEDHKDWERLDQLMQILEPMQNKDTRRSNWNEHHKRIKRAISTHLKEYHAMPTITAISEKARLSRTTVYKHLQEMKYSQHLRHEVEKYEMGLFAIMDKLMGQGLEKGDVKAMRLYFEIVSFSAKRTKTCTMAFFNSL